MLDESSCAMLAAKKLSIFVVIIWFASICGAAFALQTSLPIYSRSFALSRSSRNWRALDASPEADGDGSSPKFTPHPPNSPPPDALPQLEQELQESQRRINLYEAELEHVRELLTIRQEELDEERNNWRAEKGTLLDKIAEFTSLLSGRDGDEQAAKAEREEEFRKREDELKAEIKSLSEKLEEKTKEYDIEVQTVSELRKKLEEAQDALEYEQMSFQKEKQRLESLVTKERLALRSIEEQLKNDQERFDTTQKELMDKVKKEETKLYDSKEAWKESLELMKVREEELRDKLSKQEKELLENEKNFDVERELFNVERKELQQKITEERQKVTGTQLQLRAEQDKFTKNQRELESRIKTEEETVAKLLNKLEERALEFENEKVGIELKIEEERKKLAELEAELLDERDALVKDNDTLKSQIENEIRVRQLKKRQMKERYEKIRSEMTALLEASKRQNRKDYDRLTKKYGRRLKSVQDRVTELEGDLEVSKESGQKLQVKLDDVLQQKEKLVSEQQALSEKLSRRDLRISELEVDVDNLREVVREKDVVIERYESSFRSLARLSVRVTGKKLASTGRVLKRLIQVS